MTQQTVRVAAPGGSRDQFTPKLVSALREGYSLDTLRADALSGLTVAIVALPLSMALAIASGTSPDRGLYAAIVGGFIVSALGGSRFQIGGPAGAFIVLVAATIGRHGLDGLFLAMILSGLMMVAIGALRLGSYVKFIPFPVTVGFTTGIGVIIFASQIKDLLGLTLSGPEPGEFVAKLEALWAAAGTVNPAAVGLAIATIAIIAGVRRMRPGWPALLIAVVAASLAAFALGLPVETIQTRFGGIPNGLPAPAFPVVSLERILAVLPDAVAFALLGSIESLLSAVVADSMSGRRHRSNGELVAQGIANIATALFGGICVTGTIARTATNVKSGARTPVSGMLHSAFLLAFMLVAAPLAGFIPLAALAGVLAVVAWNMVERHAIALLARSSLADTLVLFVTLLLVVFRDLTEGIVVGFLLGTLLFIDRMSKAVAVNAGRDVAFDADEDDGTPSRRTEADADTAVYRISGAFFFGAAATVGTVLDGIVQGSRDVILDCSAVPFLDSTAANVLEGAARKAKEAGIRVVVVGASPKVRRLLMTHGLRRPLVSYAANMRDARAMLAENGLNRDRPAAGQPQVSTT